MKVRGNMRSAEVDGKQEVVQSRSSDRSGVGPQMWQRQPGASSSCSFDPRPGSGPELEPPLVPCLAVSSIRQGYWAMKGCLPDWKRLAYCGWAANPFSY